MDLENCAFYLKRGLVRSHQTKMKTLASRRPMEMHPGLSELLHGWRGQTPYPEDDQWVFASPYTNGEMPHWPESALKNHIRPAAVKAGIRKHIGWHTFRHSLGTILNNNRENVKTIQELLRHASSKVTSDIYIHGDTVAKRSALSHVSGIFAVPAPDQVETEAP